MWKKLIFNTEAVTAKFATIATETLKHGKIALIKASLIELQMPVTKKQSR